MESDKDSIRKATQAYEAKAYGQAVDLFSKIDFNKIPSTERSELLYMFAVSLHESGNHDTAVQKVKDALTLNPYGASALSAYGKWLAEEGKNHAAIARYRAAIKSNPNLWEPYYQWGYLLKKLGSHKAALRKFLTAIEKKPEHAEAYIHAGDCAFQLGQYNEALSYYENAKERGAPLAYVLFRIGNAYQLLGKKDKAIENYKACLTEDPNQGDAYENWGVLLGQEGKLPEALAKYEEGLRHDAKSPTLLLRYGEALVKVGKLKEAIVPLEEAIAILEEKIEGEWGLQWSAILADCACVLGGAYSRTGDETKARTNFKLALRHVPNHLDALQGLAALHGIYRENHVAWEFVVEGKIETEGKRMKGLRAYQVAALNLDEALKYVEECEEEIQGKLSPRDITHSDQITAYAGVLARGPLFLVS